MHILTDMLALSEGVDEVAVIEHGTVLTRGELLDRAQSRAAQIRSLVPVGCRVAIVDAQDHESIVNIIGGLMSGRPIVLFGRDEPRIERLAGAARCPVVLDGASHSIGTWNLSDDPLNSPYAGIDQAGSPEAVVLYTSGTTSEPRGVRLSQRNIASNLTSMLRITPGWGSHDRFGMVLALSHSFGLSMILMALAKRAPIVMLGGGVPSRSTVRAAKDSRVTTLACVPYYLRLLRTRGLSAGDSFAPDLHTVFFAGGGVTDGELAELMAGFQGSHFLMYGFTEASARVAVRRSWDSCPADSVGTPIPGTAVEIVSEQGSVVPVGETGRLRVTSPSLMIGYLGDEPREAGTSFTTTDLGRTDEYGNIFITGREAEMLNFRGNRVSAVAVEARAVSIGGVNDARLLPDHGDEDAQCTLQVVAADDVDHGQIRRDVLRAISPRGLIREVVFVERLEFTRTGKPLRRR